MCNISGRSFSLLSRAFHFVGARVVTQMSDITLLANNINTVNRLRIVDSSTAGHFICITGVAIELEGFSNGYSMHIVLKIIQIINVY